MGTVTVRVRSIVWFVTGAMLAAIVTVVVLQAWRVDAAPGDSDTTFVPMTPCRLVDTRQAGGSPLGPQDTRTFAAHGTNGDCTIPPDAVALSMNVTVDNQTAPNSFLTIWKDGPPRPNASSLNPAAGQPPTPNAVTTDVSAAGQFNVYNDAGPVDVIIDVNGYHTKATLQEISTRLAVLEAAQIGTLSDIEQVASAPTELPPGATGQAGVICPGGKRAIAGGFRQSDDSGAGVSVQLNGALFMQRSEQNSPFAWSVHAANPTAFTLYFVAIAICAKVGP